MPKDPVCGMEVNPDEAIKLVKDGKTYYFCSNSCREEFLGKSNENKSEKTAKAGGKEIGSDIDTKKFSCGITGMHCSACAHTIEKAIRQHPGVVSANVNFASEKATIEFDPNNTDEDRIKESINKTGYKVIEEKGHDGAEEAVLKVIGMNNPHCAGIIDKAVSGIKGVTSVKTDFA